MSNQEIALTLATDEINLVLESLGNLPFVRVYALIGKIQSQAASQMGTAGTAPIAGDVKTPGHASGA